MSKCFPDDRADVLKAIAIDLESNNDEEGEEHCEGSGDEDNEDQNEEIVGTPNEMRDTQVVRKARVPKKSQVISWVTRVFYKTQDIFRLS